MAGFPTSTYFFVNAWTWGYEDMLTSIAAYFGDKVSLPLDIGPFLSREFPQIHVDRYKHSIYSHLSHEELSRAITRDMSSTRFHACERFDRCEVVERLEKSVVYVNPVPIGSEDWSQYLDATKEKLKYGEEVTSLVRRSTPFLRLFS
jgi:DNA cross-link repair 1C protein